MIEQPPAPPLRFTNVSVEFVTGDTSTAAVDSVSLSVEQGEIFGIVGESGSGKSTLANTVLGLLPESATASGRVAVNGRDLLELSEGELRELRGDEVSMVFQDASVSLDPTWSVGDQVAETLRAHRRISRRDARKQAIALMDEVGIPDAAARYSDAPHRLSGGMRQRIVIAAALANNPQLLIADEPTTALDVTIQKQILNLIDRLRRDHGTTVLLITHDLGVVASVCDRVGVMYAGKLIEVATTADLFSRPKHPYTRALLAASPGRGTRGERLPVIPAEWSVESLQERETGADR